MARNSANAPLLKDLLRQRLKDALGQKGWRPPELARQLEKTMGRRVDPSMVRRWVNGQKLPSLEYVGPLAAALGVSADWLMRLQGPESGPAARQEQEPQGREKASRADRVSTGAGATRREGRGTSRIPEEQLSAGEIAERAAELVSRAAMRLYQRAGPRALADWLLKVSVETDPEEVRELQDFVGLARYLLRESDAATTRASSGGEGNPPE